MNNQVSGDNAMELAKGKFLILDSKILGINLCENDGILEISFTLALIRPEDKIVRVAFTGIKEYAFYDKDEASIMHYVERFKLFRQDNGRIYLSLDPYYEDDLVDERDNDFLIAADITLEYD